jgi:hypothetical protein
MIGANAKTVETHAIRPKKRQEIPQNPQHNEAREWSCMDKRWKFTLYQRAN